MGGDFLRAEQSKPLIYTGFAPTGAGDSLAALSRPRFPRFKNGDTTEDTAGGHAD